MGFKFIFAATLILLTCFSPRTAAQVDVNRLPVDKSKIQKGLQQSTITEEREGLNLRYKIDVYGQAPPIVLFTPEDNLANGPVPYGAPSHREMVEQVTPKEYRAPPADLTSLFRWLLDRAQPKK